MKKLFYKIKAMDKKKYGAYRSLAGRYKLADISVHIYHIQGDPFSPPSKVSLSIDFQKSGFKQEFIQTEGRQTAFCDYLHRHLYGVVDAFSEKIGTGNGGTISCPKPLQIILRRSVVQVMDGKIEILLNVGLPADGRTILAEEASELLTVKIPEIANLSMLSTSMNTKALEKHVLSCERQTLLREKMIAEGYIAFLENGSILARESGVSDQKLENAIPFQSPVSYEKEFDVNGHVFKGMAIPRGVSLILGGGFHGKSTLLKAIQDGVYNHIEGDGREGVVCDVTAFKVKTEEGRAIQGTDISAFMKNLPGNENTECFFTDNASGSTSQAANLIESIEANSKLILIDEDASAVNFLYRDEKMRQILPDANEPIQALALQIGNLAKHFDISFIIVAGASSAMFSGADHAFLLQNYQANDVIGKVRELADLNASKKKSYTLRPRVYAFPELGKSFAKMNQQRNGKVKVQGRSLVLGELAVDLNGLEQVQSSEQFKAVGALVFHLANNLPEFQWGSEKKVMDIIRKFDFQKIAGHKSNDLSEIRLQDLMFVLNRLRVSFIK